jgi:hypothetical protein
MVILSPRPVSCQHTDASIGGLIEAGFSSRTRISLLFWGEDKNIVPAGQQFMTPFLVRNKNVAVMPLIG